MGKKKQLQKDKKYYKLIKTGAHCLQNGAMIDVWSFDLTYIYMRTWTM